MTHHSEHSVRQNPSSIPWTLGLGFLLALVPASNGITGFLVHAGWFRSIGVEYDAWYVDRPAYLMLCWFCMGIGLTLFCLGLRRVLTGGQDQRTAPDTLPDR